MTELGACTQMANAAKHSSKARYATRNAKGVLMPGTCTITGPKLLQMYIEQGRRCAISGVPLSHLPGNWRLSPNRIDDSKDCDSNFHITALEFNTRAHWTKEKFQNLPCMQAQELTPEDIAQRAAVLAQPRKARNKRQRNEDGEYLCMGCKAWCTAEQFSSSPTLCKKCAAQQTRATITAELKCLLRNARKRSVQRNEKSKKRRKVVEPLWTLILTSSSSC
jgi:hypothetical protein